MTNNLPITWTKIPNSPNYEGTTAAGHKLLATYTKTIKGFANYRTTDTATQKVYGVGGLPTCFTVY